MFFFCKGLGDYKDTKTGHHMVLGVRRRRGKMDGAWVYLVSLWHKNVLLDERVDGLVLGRDFDLDGLDQ